MVNVIGLGYIGLPTALMLASHGIEVVGTDNNENLIDTLRRGVTTFREKGLEELFCSAIQCGIEFSCEYCIADTYIVAVPTPYDKTSKKLEPKYVIEAVRHVLSVCPNDTTIVVESTISPGSVDNYVRPLLDEIEGVSGKCIHLVHAPERIIPGNMIYELKHNSRTIGADSVDVGDRIKKMYQSFCQGSIVVTDIRTAEMTKVVENTFRDINIAFANELTKICFLAGMDVHEIIKIANMHPRVNILSPGPGVGGHCISVDPWFLVGDYPGLANLILAARKINDSMPEFILNRIYELMKENSITDVSRIGIYGITYKEDVDDTRESPTLQLLENMERHLAGGNIQIYDPMVKREVVKNQHYNLNDFLSEIDMVVIMVGHTEIRNNVDKLSEKIVFDTRHILNDIDKLYYL